jgi:Ca2+-binding EF-hand superfamily protein
VAPEQDQMFFVGEDQNTDMIIDELDSKYIYSEMFRAFDLNGNGVIDKEDLMIASETLGWKEN